MPHVLRCFISAPVNTDTLALRKILEDKGIKVYDAYDFTTGDSIQDTLKKRIKEADFAVIVITEPNPNVFYEMGIFEGKGKPVFVVIGKDSEIPHFVQNYMHLKTSLEDKEVLRISLSRFVDELISKKRVMERKSTTPKPVGARHSLQKYIAAIRQLRSGADSRGIEIEKIALEVFDELGLQFVSGEPNLGDKGVDFAIWEDNLGSSIGNPIFIQTKFGTLTPERIYLAERQLQKYIMKADAKAAILLYLDKKDRRFRKNYSLSPLILRFDFEDFVRDLSQNTFEDVTLAKRNNMVHGIPG